MTPPLDRLREAIETAPVVDMGDYDYVVTPVTDGVPAVDPDVLREVAAAFADLADFSDVDYIVTPEAMGIHHATALSFETGVPFVVVRKRSYGLPGERAVHQETGYGESELYLNGVEDGDRVVVVDDMLSTGGTLQAVCGALGDAGADVAAVLTVLRRDDDPGEFPVEPRSLLRIAVEDGEVSVTDTDALDDT